MRSTALILLHRQQLPSLGVAVEHLISVLYSTVCTLGFNSEAHGECMGNKPDDWLVQSIVDRRVRHGGGIAMPGLSEPEAQSTISVVHPAELSSETQQTSGSLRMSAVAAVHGINSSLWVLGSSRPEIVREIDNDRLWRTSHNHPSKWLLLRRV